MMDKFGFDETNVLEPDEVLPFPIAALRNIWRTKP